MTVKDLIETLADAPADAEVALTVYPDYDCWYLPIDGFDYDADGGMAGTVVLKIDC